MKDGSPKIVLCNGAVLPNEIEKQSTEAPLRLEYRSITDFEPNVKLALPDFVRDIFYLPDRILDLLEIAAYIFSADRLISHRRFAAYASELDDIDESGIYALDVVLQQIDSNEVKTILIDYVRQASNFATWNIDHFYTEMLNGLADLTDYIAGMNDDEAVENIWTLCRRHGGQVLEAMKRMRDIHDNPFHELTQDSFLEIIYERPYFKKPIQGLVSALCNRLTDAIPIAFQKNPPKDENDFNDKVSAILESDKDEFEREHPAISFALARAIPDHSLPESELLIESKYIRGSTSPSKVSEGIAADLTKYPDNNYKLFIVYDPHRSITNDRKFRRDFEKKGRCAVCIIR